MPIVIEEAQSEDYPLIRAFMLESLAYHETLDPAYYKSAEDSKTGLMVFLEKVFCPQTQYKVLIAKEGAQLLGFVVLDIIEASDFDYDTKIQRRGSIVDLYVGRSCRGLGLGEKLMGGAEAYFRSHGIRHICLQMSSFNIHAFDLYQRLGYITRQWLMFKDLEGLSEWNIKNHHMDQEQKAS